MRYFETRKARIEIIPMIDVMFFLLVFFVMVTLKMIPATGIASQLPQSSTAQALPHPKLLISLLSDGEIQVEQAKLTLAQLTARLETTPDHEHMSVTIAGAKSASVQELLHVMDACRTAGVTQVGLAAKGSQ